MTLSESQTRELYGAWNDLFAPLERLKSVEIKQTGQASLWTTLAISRVEHETDRLFPLLVPAVEGDVESEPDTLVDNVNHGGGPLPCEPNSAVAPDRPSAVAATAFATNPPFHLETVGVENRPQKGG